ncbi:acetate--CoA ligase family protein [Amorphus sp. 3PC139-8]|uniref:acetate--CoA ligase family protein n=1 Tax=Amorphus sp. 3PC139-8 TaxID=2735676 RepID=UPI00345CD0A9
MTVELRRPPYTAEALRPLIAPKSVAVVGASPRQGSFGGRTAENMAGFDGALYLVNAKYPEIDGTICYPSLADLPEVPDLAVLTTPAASVEGLLEECIAARVPAVLVYASGFAELGDRDSVAVQERIARRAREAGIRLLGPNCVGLLNYTSGARISFAGVPEGRHQGGPAIGLISQSGALGFALAQAMDRGVGFSHVLSCGNSADVDVADWVAALAEDPSCTAIACVFEGVAEPLKFLRAAEVARAQDKPLIVMKMATGERGSAVAMSHTGSLAGSSALWNALFERAGAIVVEDFEALIEAAWFFAKAPPPTAPGVAVLTGSGGAAIMAADASEATGLPLPQPSPDALSRLKELLPPFVPAQNPCDVTAGVINDVDTLLASADTLMGDPNFGALIFGYAYAYETATARQPKLSAIAAKHGKPLIYLWLTQLLEGPGTIEAERDPNVAVFRSIRRAFFALKAWSDRASRPQSTVATAPPARPESAREAAAAILAREAGPVLAERASKELLAAYGLAVPAERLVTSADDAAQAAAEIGFPVVLKVESPDIPHKTDAGGVLLGVDSAAAARVGFEQILARCGAAEPSARIDGVLVQEMVPAGLEVIVGCRNVPGFGPTVTVGMGGVLTELLSDAATDLAPISPEEAEAMIRRLRGARLFQGYRGSAPLPVRMLSECVAAVSQIAADFPEIEELDVNPVICLPDRIVAVDGLVRTAGGKAG